MKTLELWIVEYLLNSLWMVPLMFAFAWVAARMVRRAGPQMEHRVWVSALLLEAILPACGFHPGNIWAAMRLMLTGAAAAIPEGPSRITMTTGAASVYGVVSLPAWMSAGLAAAYGCSLLYFVARLGWGLRTTRLMRREAKALHLTGEAVKSWERCCEAFGLDSDVEVRSSSRIDGPVTVGIRRGVLLLPPGFSERVEASDLCAVMAHECSHMRRFDSLKNVLYNAIALPVAYHPLLVGTLRRVAETRERICDSLAAESIAGRESYARSLLRLASTMVKHAPARNLHAIGIFDANDFERRVMSLTGNNVAIGLARRIAMIAVCAMAGALACGTAMALRMEVGSKVAGPSDNADLAKKHSVSMPVLISSKTPEYPKVAKEDRLTGVCVVALTVDREGIPQDVHVLKSLHQEYDQKAIEAVQQYRFKPASQDGQPIEKQLRVEVRFQVF